MLGYIGYGLPLSYLGPTLAFMAFSITVLVLTALREILGQHEIPW